MAGRSIARNAARVLWLGLMVCFGLWPLAAEAQTDEIQVYTGELAPPGVFNLTLHNNYTPDGQKTPGFPGAIVPDHTLNGVPEWAYGVTDWFEAGLYLPLYSVAGHGGGMFNGFKLRTLFAVPHAADRTFVYGVNFEFSYNAKHWDPSRFTAEIRPIIGWHLGKVDIFFNPDLDTSYDGFDRLDFTPGGRLAYNISPHWAVAAEHYADFGAVRRFLRPNQQTQQTFAVVDYSGDPVDVEFGAGFGETDASDRLVLKLILSRDLN